MHGDVIYIYQKAFKNCTSLQTVTCTNWTGYAREVHAQAFAGCAALTHVYNFNGGFSVVEDLIDYNSITNIDNWSNEIDPQTMATYLTTTYVDYYWMGY